MKKILLVLAVAAMVVSSCGTKGAKTEDAKETTAVEAAVETAEAPAEKACCDKDSTKAEGCCKKDSCATECEKKCAEKDSCATECKKECEEKCAEKEAEA